MSDLQSHEVVIQLLEPQSKLCQPVSPHGTLFLPHKNIKVSDGFMEYRNQWREMGETEIYPLLLFMCNFMCEISNDSY